MHKLHDMFLKTNRQNGVTSQEYEPVFQVYKWVIEATSINEPFETLVCHLQGDNFHCCQKICSKFGKIALEYQHSQ